MLEDAEEIERRLLKRTVIMAREGSCWVCNYSTRRGGYPRIYAAGNTQMAHRVAWQLWRGEIPEDMCVCHTCDNPKCINPSHLFLGTQLDNMRDKCEKHRQAKGERSGRYTHPEKTSRGDQHYARTNPEKLLRGQKHGMSKLSEEDVSYIRMSRENGFTLSSIAKAFNIYKSTVGRIVNRKAWIHVK